MEIILSFFDFLIHFDVYLGQFINEYHSFTYLFLFLIIFFETGLVIMPFLPGDSLLFAVGAFSARGDFDFLTISTTLLLAAILGDTVNYSIGKYLGPKIFSFEKNIFFNQKHLLKAHDFYEKYGAKTIILARFIPIIRTFAPFVAGIGTMSYRKFMSYNIIGASLWIFTFIPLGHFFGNLPFVQKNFKIVIMAIIIISILPVVFEYFKAQRRK